MSAAKPSTLAATVLLITGLVVGSPASAVGVVDALAAMGIGNLRFSFDDPNARLVWAADWYGEVAAYAHDTDSGVAADYDAYLGNDGFIDAEAQTAHVHSLATYQVVDGLNVAIDPNAGIAAGTLSELHLVGKHKQADGFAYADFDNFFYIASSAPVGATVLTTIELDFAGLLDAYANEFGYFEVFAGAFMELYETDQLSGDVTDLIDFDELIDFASGTNTAYFNSFDGTLTITAELTYDDIYWLYNEADSEVYGAVPISGTLPLLLLGAGVIAWRRRCYGSRDALIEHS
jgi:hypothetical protein